jgi:acyl carrier protein
MIQDQAQQVFREVFENPTMIITDKTTAADIPEWDSLAHINLIIALENSFGIQFTSEEVTSMANVGDLFRLLERRKR